jgi:predicted transposase/invertase (TIGR01784 family)
MSKLRAKDDVVFKMVFGQQKYDKLLISLLNAILDLPIDKRITSVQIVGEYRLGKSFTKNKVAILDIKAIDSNHSRINIEIQLRNEYNMNKRTLFYCSKLYSEQIKQGSSVPPIKKDNCN